MRDEWTGLMVCLSGREGPHAHAELARRARSVELEYLIQPDVIEGIRARKAWLAQCGVASTRLLGLLAAESHSARGDAARKPLRDALDDVGDALASDRLPSATVLHEVVDEAEKLGLATADSSNAATARRGHEPVLAIESLDSEPMFRGRVSLAASDPVPARDVHLLLEQDGWARACIFSPAAPALATHRCRDVPGGAGADARWRWESPNELRGDFLTRTTNGRSAVFRMDQELVDMGFVDGEMLGVVGSGDDATLLAGVAEHEISLYAAEHDRLRPLRRVPATGLSWILPFGNEVLSASSNPRSREQDRIVATPVNDVAQVPDTGKELASVFERSVPLACESESSRFVMLTKGAARSAHAWDREVVVLFRDADAWSSPVKTTAQWMTMPSAGVAHPQTPTLSCGSDAVTVTWTEGDEQNVVRQLRCSRRGCVTKLARLSGDLRYSLVAALDGKVLLVRNDIAHRTLRIRLAPIEDLARTPDVVLFDDGETVRPGSPSMALHALVREKAAIILLRIARGDGVDVFAVRIDGTGAVTLSRRV
ncbi:hypothetical protein BH11MYX4_BH11MYX4_06300 [soil metagenome]